MCPFGGTDPQDRGLPARRHGRQGGLGGIGWCSCVCGIFFVWARAAHPRPSATPASRGTGFLFLGVVLFADRVLFLLVATKCVPLEGHFTHPLIWLEFERI